VSTEPSRNQDDTPEINSPKRKKKVGKKREEGRGQRIDEQTKNDESGQRKEDRGQRTEARQRTEDRTESGKTGRDSLGQNIAAGGGRREKGEGVNGIIE
jgi:hypothetical protein